MPLATHLSFLYIAWGIWSALFLTSSKADFTVINSANNTDPEVLKGLVLDEETKQPVSFANIVLIQSKKATQANGTGEFELQFLPTSARESIRFTALGYSSKIVEIATLLKSKSSKSKVMIYLKPKYQDLQEVQVKAKSKKWRERKVGYNIDRGTSFHHQFSPLDTLIKKSGQEIGNRFELKKYPAYLQSISFGLAGSGNVKAIIGLRVYTLKNNLPDRDVLPKDIIIRTAPHHTGWITVDVREHNITLKEDFAVAIEWLSDTNKLSKNSLMAFATHSEGQITYVRNSDQERWKVIKPTFTNINSIGLYVTVAY